ncbi:sulfatase-like hydrolase/transferase [Rhodococcus hoagii]|nr:sulfatase-like hydrolase/transferase [Prescottella equi]
MLIVLLDDVGFGASSAFGGPAQTPTAQRLADDGLKYTRFHTTALCSPTRAALLTGRNHHTVGMGSITEMATAAPGYTSVRRTRARRSPRSSNSTVTPPRTSASATRSDLGDQPGGGRVRTAGRHRVTASSTSTASSAARPTSGIPPCTRARRVEPWGTPEEGYPPHEDLADKAIAWVRQQKVLTPDKPFFLYFAPGATHAPHHVPQHGPNGTGDGSTTVGRASGADLRAAEGTRRRARGCRTHPSARRDSRGTRWTRG